MAYSTPGDQSSEGCGRCSVARTLRSTRCASRCPATRILGTSGAGSNLTPRAAAVHGNLVSSGNAVCAQAVTLGAKSGSSVEFVEPSQRSKATITPRVRPDRFCCEAAIHDSDTAAQTLCCSLTEVERFVFEICDQITTVRRIQQLASHLSGPAVCENDVRQILDMLISRRLVIREEDRYLGLPVLTYTPVNPTQFIRQLAPTAAEREHLIHA
jgi:hypothetical protein